MRDTRIDSEHGRVIVAPVPLEENLQAVLAIPVMPEPGGAAQVQSRPAGGGGYLESLFSLQAESTRWLLPGTR